MITNALTIDRKVRDVLADGVCPMQVGGGIRTDDDIRALIDDGADWVIVGTRALEEPAWLAEWFTFPGLVRQPRGSA